MSYFRAFLCWLALAGVVVAESKPTAHDPATIPDKVVIKFEEELYLRFKAAGIRLIEPRSYKGKFQDTAMLKLELMTGGPAPGRVLVVHNHFDRTLRFLALVRMKGESKFVVLSNQTQPVEPGKSWCEFWPDATPIEEAVLYQFTLTDEPKK